MKKVILSLCLCMIALCASAEKGDRAAGINLGIAPVVANNVSATNFGLGAKYQFHVSTPVRFEAAANYWFKASGYSIFDIAVNAHYLFDVATDIKVYPLIGLGYAHIGWNVGDYVGTPISGASLCSSKLLLNLGVGAEYALDANWTLGAEIKYQYINDFSRLPISVSATYHF